MSLAQLLWISCYVMETLSRIKGKQFEWFVSFKRYAIVLNGIILVQFSGSNADAETFPCCYGSIFFFFTGKQ